MCDLIVAMHGDVLDDSACAGAYGYDLIENDILTHGISDLFVGIRFCDNCTIELRSCKLGQYEGMLKRIANNSKCTVKAYKTSVHAKGPNLIDKIMGGDFNPAVTVAPD